MKLLLLFFLTIASTTSVLGQSPPSGGGQFFVPARFYRQPPPSTRYGPPPLPSSTTTTTTSTTTTTTEAPATTTEEDVDVSGGAVSIANARSGGIYYVLQPDGRLQRIAYAHGPTPASAQLSSSQQQPGYLARFHYRDLEPLGAPVFSYSTPELVRLNK